MLFVEQVTLVCSVLRFLNISGLLLSSSLFSCNFCIVDETCVTHFLIAVSRVEYALNNCEKFKQLEGKLKSKFCEKIRSVICQAFRFNKIQTCIFGYLDLSSTYWAIEQMPNGLAMNNRSASLILSHNQKVCLIYYTGLQES